MTSQVVWYTLELFLKLDEKNKARFYMIRAFLFLILNANCLTLFILYDIITLSKKTLKGKT